MKPNELIQNNYYINIKYGLGRYKGGIIEDGTLYFLFMYDNEEKLYCTPQEVITDVRKYNSNGQKMILDRLSRTDKWIKKKVAAQKKAKKQAKELLEIYKKRSHQKGFQFSKDSFLQKQFENSCPFELSPGQKKSLNEIKQDMESIKPMDRLLIGDVGYGKTEVALRAVLKCVLNHRQAIVLTPSKILSHQHYEEFKDRLKDYDIRVELLTSQRNKKRTQLLQKIELGEIDIIIGTQNVLSDNIHYKDLGLMVIDEEHKFGVSTKDKIKKISSNIDILSMTGTPIPRTLNLAKLHIRDISVIDTPPPNKKAPITEGFHWNDNKIKFAIERELNRGGQVFCVDNNIEKLPIIKKQLEQLVPGIRIIIIHGEMKSNEIDDIMVDVLNKKYDLVLATTIIEVGITIKNINTIIINKFNMLGLSTLCQLRGRIGRSNNNIDSYCILTYGKDKILDSTAKKRLNIMCKNSYLGSGFEISKQDMEMRGVGELIGIKQSGQIANGIGMDYYMELMQNAMEEIS